jgi:hypothetical protein
MTALGFKENGNSNATTYVDNMVLSQQPPPKVFSISMITMMMNRVISASLLLPLIASANADGLLSSLRDPKTVEQKEGVVVMDRRELQELKERALLSAEVSDDSQQFQSFSRLFELSLLAVQ